MRKRELSFLVFLLLAIVATATTIGLRGQPQQSQDRSRMTREEKERTLPIVDFDEPDPTNKQAKEARKARAQQYDKYSGHRIEEPSGSFSRIFSGASNHLSAIPVAESDTIAIATVINATAHLSSDRTAVYSEFTTRVDEVLKQTTSALSIGGTICLHRLGGVVRFRNGYTLTYETAGEGVPIVGRKYIFFLTRSGLVGDFRIVTGYDITDSKVIPLDGSVSDQGTRQYPFDEYAGRDVDSFLQTVRVLLNQKAS